MSSTPRANRRFEIDWAVEVRLGDRALTGRAKNASLGGLFLEIDASAPLGERVHLRFQVGAHVVETAALVRWHGERGLGVQFDGLRARDVYALGKHFETLG